MEIPTLHIPGNICRRVSGILYAVRIHVTVIRRVFAIHFEGQRRLAATEKEKTLKCSSVYFSCVQSVQQAKPSMAEAKAELRCR